MKVVQKLSTKQVRSLLMLSLMLLTITAIAIVSASIRAPPYANAKVDYLGYENAVAYAEAEPGYGRAYLYSYINIPLGIGGASLATSEVEFNEDPVHGNSPVVSYLPYIYVETYFHLKGTIDTDDSSFGSVWIAINTYVYKDGKWEFYSDEFHKEYYDGTYNEGHLLSGYVENYDTSVEKVTATPFVETDVYGYCNGEYEVCPWIQGVADFYTNGYPYSYVYVPYIEVLP